MSHLPEAKFSSVSSQKPKYLGHVVHNMVKFSTILWSSLNVRNLRWQRRRFCNFSYLPLLQFLTIIFIDERSQTATPSVPEGWSKHLPERWEGGLTMNHSFFWVSGRHQNERTREKAQPELLLAFFSPLLQSVYRKQRYQGCCQGKTVQTSCLAEQKDESANPTPFPSQTKPTPHGFCSRKLAPSFSADLTGTGNSHTGTRSSADQRVSMKK